ncbi:STAS domain-containing protein [Leptospira idonii]|uniref:STAS domain-containing protein n=1 Tax=Leptospira idonii TaxID=1193500 RepID=A0A4R9M4B6_9LEPT|nr:STAS domain-containing protein [Leptospira idonii]TGN19608.1 STAS domain-containing protein [Leptospira idonii]
MKSLLIRLSGHLSAEMGSDLYLNIKETSSEPSLFCLDFSELASIDEVGVEYLKKISNRAKATGSKVALSGISPEWKQILESHQMADTFSLFSDILEAKLALETHLSTENPANEMRDVSIEGEKRIGCPECGQTLRWQSKGDHSCPSCQAKFAVNYKGWISTYERLL